MRINSFWLSAVLFAVATLLTAGTAGAMTITDTRGRQIEFSYPPQRAVSAVPGITDTICALGANHALAGVTFHGALPQQKNHLPVVGGFSFPDVEKITALDPDVVFVSSFQKEAVSGLEERGLKTVCLDTTDFDQGLNIITILGKIFGRQQAAREILDGIQTDLSLVQAKLDQMVSHPHKRVFRLMGRDTVMTPSANAFLNQLVIRAGGVPMAPTGDGMVTPIDLDQWQQFNPEVIFGCGEDRVAADLYFSRPGWQDVAAVQNGQIHYFPCELTCRVGPRTGYFVQWLAATLYGEAFFIPEHQVYPDKMLDNTPPLAIDLDIIKDSRIVKSRIADFTHKTLVIDFKTPQKVLSTLEGFKTGIIAAANHYLPPPAWYMAHAMTVHAMQTRILDTLEKDPSSSALLMTGADMDHVAVTAKTFREITVTAAVTAGVTSNAQRAGQSTGRYYEPGTINIILMTNMRLSPRAMARSLITATEAKTAALADLDIRSSDDPIHIQATGTGTDNILVVQGDGPVIDAAGGHTKMGEMIASAVYDGVSRAVFLQNGLAAGRPVFQRLAERGIFLHTLTDGVDCPCAPWSGTPMAQALQSLLMEPRYAGMVEQALLLSDALERGQVSNIEAFLDMTRAMAREIAVAGGPVESIVPYDTTRQLPEPLKQVFNALMTGIARQHAAQTAEPSDVPRKIISLVPALTKTLYALDAGNRLIANTTYCETPPELEPMEKIGTLLQVNVEKILSLKPDLVLASQFTKPDQIKVLKEFGIPVVQFQNPVTFEEICADTLKIGRLIGASEKAEDIVAWATGQVDTIQSCIASLPPRKVFIQIGIKPLHTATADTFVNEFIRLSGGINIAAGEPSGVYSREKVVRQNPDVIFITTMGSSKAAGVTEKQQWMTFSNMAAVKNQAVHLLDSEMICSPTPIIFVQGLKQVVQRIHPDQLFPVLALSD